jgi:hypothetical protein
LTLKKFRRCRISCFPFYYLFCKLQKGCIRLAAASDKAYQLLVHGRWFSPGIPGSSTTKTGRHDIAEILLQVALKHKKSIKQSSNDLYEARILAVLVIGLYELLSNPTT